jgi:hypothetical protein
MMIKNLQVREFREKAIKEAIASNDIQRAYKLALDGVEQDKNERPGIVPTWNHWTSRMAKSSRTAKH